MNILIVGGGGREHALAWKSAQSSDVECVYVAPGNAGTATESKVKNVNINAEDIHALLEFAKQNAIDLTIVGPEAPLCLGIVDVFSDAGLKCFGPTKSAAQLEGSKAFTKDFLARNKIPTAAYGNFTNVDQAKNYVKEVGTPIVIKADGLAAGKGVIIAHTETEAFDAIDDMLAGNKFGDAGHRVVVEEFLLGEEASFIVMVDGKNILPLATSQDHKARDNGDKGPNTGGMGAYSPAAVVSDKMHHAIMQQVIIPTVEGMAREGNEYTGFLYAGIMISPEGIPKVLEYNCRFGDPETQPIIFRLKSDINQLCLSAIDKNLDQQQVKWDERFAVGIVLAAGGYPDSYEKEKVISGLNDANFNAGINAKFDSKVFHAGTKMLNGNIVTSGGRVLCVVALGDSVTEAQKNAYKRVDTISWDNIYYRNDIAHRAISRESH